MRLDESLVYNLYLQKELREKLLADRLLTRSGTRQLRGITAQLARLIGAYYTAYAKITKELAERLKSPGYRGFANEFQYLATRLNHLQYILIEQYQTKERKYYFALAKKEMKIRKELYGLRWVPYNVTKYTVVKDKSVDLLDNAFLFQKIIYTPFYKKWWNGLSGKKSREISGGQAEPAFR